MNLAQLSGVDPKIFLHVIMVLVAVGAVATPIYFGAKAMAKRSQRIEPQPLQVEAAPRYVTPEMCEKSHDTLCQRIAALETQATEGVERRRAIYEKIAQVEAQARAETSVLRKDAFGELSRLGERLNDLPDRIIATLANLGFLPKGKS